MSSLFSTNIVSTNKIDRRIMFVHCNALFLCTFFRISQWQFLFFMSHFSCCTFFVLNHFIVALFCVVIFSCSTFFRIALCLRIAIFYIALLHLAMFSFCIFLFLHSSHVAIFSCCTFFILYYFQRWSQDLKKYLRWRALWQ